MTSASEPKQPSFLARLFGGFRAAQLEQEKARLEAFLSAFPGEYCGWTKEGAMAHSPDLPTVLGLERLSDMDDLQNALSPGDAAALEGLFDRLAGQGIPFVLSAASANEEKIFKISGASGQAVDTNERFDVLWIEDISAEVEANDEYIAQVTEKEVKLEKFASVLDTIPRPLWLRDSAQKIIWCNDVYADFLERSKDDILTEQREIFGQPRKKSGAAKDDIAPGKDLAKQALSTGQQEQAEVHATIKGQRKLLRVAEMPLPAQNMTIGIAYNITREEDLITELERYRSSNRELLEQLRSAIAIYSADQKLEFYNTAFAQLWGLEDQYLNTKPTLGDLMEKLRETRRLPEQADFRRFKQSWLDMFTGLIEPHEDMLYLPDGSALRMLVVPHSMGGIMMTFEDVTSRLELESSYNTLIAVQKETLDNLAEAVSVYGGDGRIKLWNPAFGRLWSLHPEDLEGEPHISSIVEKMKPFFESENWQEKKEELIAKGLDRIMHESRLERSDGSLVDFVTVPLPDGGVLVTHSDVTDTVRVENALREKAKALEAAEQLKLDFLANVSYQLRTPLNAIMGFNEILDQQYFGELNERQKQYTGDIREASESLLGLINDILDLSTLEAGYMTLQRDEVSIYKMLQHVKQLVTDWARKQEIKITLKCAKNIGAINVDERRLQQAIINIIRNSITHTPAGGEITVVAKRSKEGINITISDTGVGIKEEDKMRIFEPFERAGASGQDPRLSRSGAGLGLSLVRNIIALHGGTVDLDSAPEEGTTVTLFLPFVSVPTNLTLPVKKTANQ